jgi:hypothetical protein
MTTCDRCQALLLEHLYELLDAEERQLCEAHLADCAHCQAAMVKARAQQHLLGMAAKERFEAVRFSRPSDVESTPIVPMPPAATRGRWRSYALAASVLLSILTVGTPLSLWWSGRQHLKDDIAVTREKEVEVRGKLSQVQAPVQRQNQQVGDLSKQIANLQTKQHEDSVRKQQELHQRERFLTVTGPETLEPGAPNNYMVEVKNLAGEPVETKLGARFLDAARKELVGEKSLAFHAEAPGRYRLSLPRDLDLKGANGVILELFAQDEEDKVLEKKDGVAASFRTALRVSRPLYITHLTTDKPMYQPGQTVWFRSLALERYSLKPAEEHLHLHYTIRDASQALVLETAGSTQLVNALDSKPLLGPDQKPVKGIGAGSWAIPPGTPGGEYTLTVADLYSRFPPEKRKFIVNEYEISPFRKKLEFTKKSYGPGDDVAAECLVEPAAGGKPIANQPVRATVRVDGKTIGSDGKPSDSPIQLKTDDQGAALVRFRLPTQIERGEASLAVTFTDGASTDTIVRTIPIILKKFYVQLHPEGGDLVAGVPNRVYFQARTTLDKPAELTGRVVDADGRAVARLETLNDPKEPGANQGMGMFEFTPEAGKKYQLQIDSPVGVTAEYEFPAAKTDGVVLSVIRPVMAAKEPVALRIHDTKGERKLLVGVYCRGRLLAHQTITAKALEPVELKLEPSTGVGGVYRVTAFEQTGSQYTPRAERLVYRAPAEKLDLTLRPHRNRFMPGEKAFVNLQARTEKGEPAPSILMVSVIDETVKSMADEKTAKAMPTHFYLTTEVRKPEDLEFADFMLGEHPKAPLALDLLLGTQGWRRFAEQDPGKFQEQYKEDATRMLATIGQTPFQASNHQEVLAASYQRIQDEVAKAAVAYTKEIQALQQKQQLAQNEVEQAYVAAEAALNTLRRELSGVESSLASLLGKLDRHDVEWRSIGLVLSGIILVFACFSSIIVGLVRKGRAAMPYYATAACCSILLAVGLMFVNVWDLASPEIDLAKYASGSGSQQSQRDTAVLLNGDDHPALRAPGPDADRGPDPRTRLNRLGAAKHDAFAEKRAEPPSAPALAPAPAAAEAAPADADRPHALKTVEGARAKALKFEREQVEGKPAERELQMRRRAADERFEAGAPGGFREQAGMLAREKLALDGKLRAAKPATATSGGYPYLLNRFVQDKDAITRFGGVGGAGAPAPGLPGGGRGGIGGPGYPGRPVGDAYQPEIPPPPPIVVREFAHRRSGPPTLIRKDFTETLAWYPVVVLPDGTGQISFELSDSLTTFEALAFGHSVDGRLGVGKVRIESRLPFAVQPKIPIEVTASDTIDIPVSVANETEERREVSVRAQAMGLKLTSNGEERLTLGADQKARRVFRFTPELIEGQAQLKIDGRTEFFGDSVERSIRVVPDGFPVLGSKSDVLEKIARHDLTLPETWIKGTLQLQVQVYPSTLADLQKGLEGLLREPHGCFEQTSTSNYPNILILDYLRESDQAKPEVAKRARELLDRGYQKLTSFECQKPGGPGRQGYEWFGGTAPPHEALTAYGLLQFRDMARVGQVDQAMVDRTRTYLLSRKDGKGGFQRNQRALDTFGRAPEDITNAYIVWALTESSKDDDVAKELDALKSQAKSSEDAYFLALVANSLLNRGQNDDGLSLTKRLAQAQKEDGHLDAARMSITGSSGRHLQIETTALTLLAWLKANRPEFTKNVQLAVRWIGQQRDGGGAFGSTQSTILALKALIEHTKANKRPAEPGELVLHVGGKEAARLPFQPTGPNVPPLVLKGDKAQELLKPGANDIRVEVTGNNVFPYTLSWSYQTLKPASGEGCPVQLEAKLDKTEANENDTARLNVTLRNVSGKGQAMTVAIVGLPAGLTLPEDLKQLKDYTRLEENDTKPGRISAFEIRGRELVLYWRDLAPDAKIDVPLDLVCRVPGQYRGPASRAYLYYNHDAKHWIDPLSIKIKAGE